MLQSTGRGLLALVFKRNTSSKNPFAYGQDVGLSRLVGMLEQEVGLPAVKKNTV